MNCSSYGQSLRRGGLLTLLMLMTAARSLRTNEILGLGEGKFPSNTNEN